MLSARYSYRISMQLEFSGYIFGKKTQIPNFIKIRPVGTELFHAYSGRKDSQARQT
jgi:hypothetical protein